MYFQKKTCVFLLTLVLVMLMTTSTSAQTCEGSGFMGKFNITQNVTLTQTCPTCTFINITVTDPDSNIVFENVPMTESSPGVFTFGPNDTISQKLNLYIVQGVSNLDNPFKSCYLITNIKTEITTPEAIIYVILILGIFVIFLFLVWGFIGLPARNRRNELNRVIGIEYMKYPKLACLFLAYAFFTWLVNILLIVSSNFLTLGQFTGFFNMVFNFLLAGLYAFFVAMIVIFFVLAARDLKLQDLLTRGILPR